MKSALYALIVVLLMSFNWDALADSEAEMYEQYRTANFMIQLIQTRVATHYSQLSVMQQNQISAAWRDVSAAGIRLDRHFKAQTIRGENRFRQFEAALRSLIESLTVVEKLLRGYTQAKYMVSIEKLRRFL